jgi:hypothetical protein
MTDNNNSPTSGYKYVLVGMYWYGEEPTMYLEDENENDQRVANAIERALRKQHPRLESVDVGFIYDGIEPDHAYRVGTWEHAREVITHLAWRLLIALRKA